MLVSLGLFTMAMVQTGCFGSFKLTQAVYQWNSSIEDKTVRSMVFFALCAIPVYEAAVVIDWAILNVVEYWDGSNPVSMKPGEKEEKLVNVRGRHLRLEASQNTIKVFERKKDGEQWISSFEYQPANKTWYLRKDKTLITLSRIVQDKQGIAQFEIFTRNGTVARHSFPGEPVAFERFGENDKDVALR